MKGSAITESDQGRQTIGRIPLGWPNSLKTTHSVSPARHPDSRHVFCLKRTEKTLQTVLIGSDEGNGSLLQSPSAKHTFNPQSLRISIPFQKGSSGTGRMGQRSVWCPPGFQPSPLPHFGSRCVAAASHPAQDMQRAGFR